MLGKILPNNAHARENDVVKKTSVEMRKHVFNGANPFASRHVKTLKSREKEGGNYSCYARWKLSPAIPP